MYILGIFNGHDSSAALIKNGEVIVNFQEERLNRIKHYAGLPVASVERCLNYAKISSKELDYITIPRLRKTPDIETLFGNPASGFLETEEFGESGSSRIIRRGLVGLASIINVGNQFGLPVYATTYSLSKQAQIIHLDHHLAHAASAFYSSGFEKCLVVTADGAGDALSTTVWLGEDLKLRPILKIGRNGSLGFFYNVVTEALGWQISEGEGKTMGLAPYGNTKKTKGVLDFCLPVYKDGQLIKPHNFGFPKLWLHGGAYHWHFQESDRIKRLVEKYGREDIAAEAQRCLEEQMLSLVGHCIGKVKIKKLAAAGGVFLNVKMNQRIQEIFNLDEFFVYPDAGDGGVPVGSALYVYFNQKKRVLKLPKQIKSIYWGSEYTNEEIKYFLDLQKIKYVKLPRNQLTKKTAEFLSKGKIVGWFQGRMETGPRALGSRSILMDPRKAENRDIINKRVKFRESFRPFTPSMIETAAEKFIESPKSAPFMTISYSIRPNMKDLIPAVVHIDGTLRPQILERKVNPLYYDLIKEFGRITAVPVLLNTSFNIKGEPIVESPRDAIKCFFDTGLDYLVIGNFIVAKENL